MALPLPHPTPRLPGAAAGAFRRPGATAPTMLVTPRPEWGPPLSMGWTQSPFLRSSSSSQNPQKTFSAAFSPVIELFLAQSSGYLLPWASLALHGLPRPRAPPSGVVSQPEGLPCLLTSADNHTKQHREGGGKVACSSLRPKHQNRTWHRAGAQLVPMNGVRPGGTQYGYCPHPHPPRAQLLKSPVTQHQTSNHGSGLSCILENVLFQALSTSQTLPCPIPRG